MCSSDLERRLRQPEDERPVEELETARLPSLKSVMRQSLMGVLRASSAPSLVLLGGLMRSEDPAEKRTLLRQLVDLGADIRLIDGGVRDIAHCEHAVRDFAVVDFESLDLASQADAAVAIFHPGCPLPVVRQCFAVAFERQFSPASPAEGRRWNELVKSAAVVVCRKDRSLLDEGFAVATGIAADASRQALFRSLVEWAWQQASPVVRPLARPVEDYLRRISGEDPVDAERAAIEVMAQYDLIVASVPLG